MPVKREESTTPQPSLTSLVSTVGEQEHHLDMLDRVRTVHLTPSRSGSVCTQARCEASLEDSWGQRWETRRRMKSGGPESNDRGLRRVHERLIRMR